MDLSRCESILLRSHWVLVVIDLFTRRIVGFGIGGEAIDGPTVCRMFNRAIAGHAPPARISADHDPLFRFHRWLANLRILEVEEIQSVPYAPASHRFIERLIGTIRREYLDQMFFWNSIDLERKLSRSLPDAGRRLIWNSNPTPCNPVSSSATDCGSNSRWPLSLSRTRMPRRSSCRPKRLPICSTSPCSSRAVGATVRLPIAFPGAYSRAYKKPEHALALLERSSAEGKIMTTHANATSNRTDAFGLREQPAGFDARAIDRWIFVFTAVSFIVIALTGFIPDSLHKVQLIGTGQRPPFPLVLHFHAVLMGLFLMLLLTQTVLVATDRPDLHRRLGRVAMVLVPALVVVGFILVPTIYHQAWSAMQGAPPQLRPKMHQTIFILDLILLLQLRSGILFPVFILIGLRARTSDPGLHKRMMFLATVIPLMAAVDRMTWLPTTMPTSPASNDIYMLAAVAPMFIWDVIRNRTVHKAYLIWVGVNLPIAVVFYSLWRSQWWHTIAPRLMGV